MRAPLACSIVLASLVPSLAFAQAAPSIDARTFRPSPDPGANLVIEPVSVPKSGEWNLGLWSSYAFGPVALRNAAGEIAFRPVEHQSIFDLTGAIGVLGRGAVGLSVPVVAYQSGETAPGVASVPSTAFGDASLWIKGTVIDNDRGSGIVEGFGLALVGNVSAPTGARSGFAGEGAVTTSLKVLAEYTYIVATLQASLGYKLRPEHRTWPGGPGAIPFGDEIPWHFGFRLRPKPIANWLDSDDRQQIELAAHGSLPASPVAPFGWGDPGATVLSPVLITLSDRIALGKRREFSVVIGADVGATGALGTPVVRGVAGLGWAPRTHDEDNDTVDDEADQCPGLAEDLDGIDDQDGCPEDDADDDMVPDVSDACPRDKGVIWSDPKRDGCPGPDSDSDRLADPVDACPNEPGEPSDDPKKNGCPPPSSPTEAEPPK